ncbi:hypothetical protein ACS3QZ_20030 (plasmid) [Shimia sp. W99]
MQKLTRKQVLAEDLVDQVRRASANPRNSFCSRGWFSVELSWERERDLDAGRIHLHLIDGEDPNESAFQVKVKGLNLQRTRTLERVLAAEIEKAWLSCVVHSRTANQGMPPNIFSVVFG